MNHEPRTRQSLSQVLSLVLVATVASLCPGPVGAQDAQPRVFRLELKEMDGIEHGRAAVVKGDAGAGPQRFLVEGVTMETPVTVLLRAVRPDDAVDLSLTKYAWNQPLREGTAQGEPLAMKFRTEGEFQLTVTADDDAVPYRLLVWVGDPVEPALTPVVVSPDEFADGGDAAGSDGGGLVLWVIAGLLGAVVLLLTVLVLRRKS